jgi:hypothetical protein
MFPPKYWAKCHFNEIISSCINQTNNANERGNKVFNSYIGMRTTISLEKLITIIKSIEEQERLDIQMNPLVPSPLKKRKIRRLNALNPNEIRKQRTESTIIESSSNQSLINTSMNQFISNNQHHYYAAIYKNMMDFMIQNINIYSQSNQSLWQNQQYYQASPLSVINDPLQAYNQYLPHVINQSFPVINQPPPVVNQPPPVVNQPPPVVNQPPPVVNQPPSIVNQPPSIVNQPPLIVNQPPPIVNQPPPIVNQPPQVINQPLQVINQPPQAIINQPPQVINQPPQAIINQPPQVINQLPQAIINQLPQAINQPYQAINQQHSYQAINQYPYQTINQHQNLQLIDPEPLTLDKINNFKVVELKAELKRLGLTRTGLKADPSNIFSIL